MEQKKNIIKVKGERINRFKHLIRYLMRYSNVDNPEFKNDSFLLVMSRFLVFFFIMSSFAMSLIFACVTIVYTVGYVSVNVSPSLFEYHSKNETMVGHDYFEDGINNIMVVSFFCLMLLFLYAGLFMPCLKWRKDLEKDEKDLEIGNAEL